MASLTGVGTAFGTSLLGLVFQAVNIALIADNTATTPLTNLYIALHTADPTQAGTQNSSEATYTGYARVPLARTSAGWTISGAAPEQVVNAAAITFPACTGGSNTVTWFTVGTLSSGAGVILYGGSLTAPLSVSLGITPSFAAGSLVVTED